MPPLKFVIKISFMSVAFKFQEVVCWWRRSVLHPDLASEGCLLVWDSFEEGGQWNFSFAKCSEVSIHNSCYIILGRVFDDPYCSFGMNIYISHCYTPSSH
jgi:hypothetical protein